MPVFQLTHVQSYLGEACTNRYFYRSSLPDATGSIDELLTEFRDTMVPIINEVQSADVNNVKLEAFTLEGISFSSLNLTGSGGRVGASVASWMALSYKLQRSTRQVRSGGKRYCGLIEEVVAGNALFPDPTYEGFVNDLAEALDDALITTSGTFVPVLVKFDPANPGTVLVDEIIASASFTGLSTQNSRKPE